MNEYNLVLIVILWHYLDHIKKISMHHFYLALVLMLLCIFKNSFLFLVKCIICLTCIIHVYTITSCLLLYLQVCWLGANCNVDQDGCANGPCNSTSQCRDLTPSVQQAQGLSYQCSSCRLGYALSSSLTCIGKQVFQVNLLPRQATIANFSNQFVWFFSELMLVCKFCRCGWM